MMNRNLTTAFKYQTKDNVRAVIIFYLIVCAIIVLISIGVATTSTSSRSTMGGLDTSTTIFLFVAGIVSFKEPFRMLMQNGVSRRTMMKSKILTALALTFFMAVCTTVLMIIGKALTSSMESYSLLSTYEQTYALKAASQSFFTLQLSTLIFNFLQYLSVFSLGLFVALIFYRCGKAGKIAVGAGVPVTIFLVLPIIDAVYFKMKITKSIFQFFDTVFGITAGRPWAAFISFAVLAVLGLSLSWLLMRKADIKQ